MECASVEEGGSELSNPRLSRHLELSFVSAVSVYSVLLGQPTGTDDWRNTEKEPHTHWRIEKASKRRASW